ncbi:unnamed protein product [Tilletia caries]|uniref:Vid27 N-terminal domain-containing protein n=1 Tax=Tilletia caries TaxID=13290 RepID=A0ABN7J4B6_9BASI|nr:unnamed protein product [Tilletia caries]
MKIINPAALILLSLVSAHCLPGTLNPCSQIFHSQASFNPSSAPRTEQGRLQACSFGPTGSREERFFIINTDLRFRESTTQDDDEPTFVWHDPANDDDEELLDFVIHSAQCAHEHAFDDSLAALQYNSRKPGSQPAEEGEDKQDLKADDPDALAARTPLSGSSSSRLADAFQLSIASADKRRVNQRVDVDMNMTFSN